MGFLSNLFSSAWNGLSGGVSSLGRGVDDLAHGDLSSAGGELENSYKNFSDIPGLGISRALYQGFNGDLSWNPYSNDNSVWDYAAGGSASEDPKNRQVGRAIGTAIGSYFTGGALSSMYGAAAGGALNGAAWAGAQAAGTGQDVGSATLKGAATGGLGSYVAGQDPAGYMGVTNTAGKAAINSGIASGLSTAVRGGDSSAIGKSALTAGATSGIGALGDSSMDNGVYGSSPAPWAQERTDLTGTGFNQQSYAGGSPGNAFIATYGGDAAPRNDGDNNPFNDYLQSALGFMKQPGANGRSRWADATQGLAGMWLANRQRRDASRMLNEIGGGTGAYGEQMKRQLMARDAASGRRSDYGGREMQLQSALAQMAARNAPAINQLTQQKYGGYLGMLNNGMSLANASGAFTPNYNLSTLPQMNTSVPQFRAPEAALSDEVVRPGRMGRQWGGY